ncbi:hypothetical protein B0H21DRAFT_693713 [Amylocystis lapponica]|nr:hypothetical protein B0H21DRAFT_693713 [Amylocystis lapponica]
MTKHPTHKAIPVANIISPLHYDATHFIAALARYVVQYNNPTLTPQQIEEHAIDIHFPFLTLPTFHRIKFWNERVHGMETLDSIHFHPRKSGEDEEVVIPARFDTALIQVQGFNQDGQDMAHSSIKGYCIFNCFMSDFS